MKKLKTTKKDHFSPSTEGIQVIKEFLEDERDGVKYHESYSELMNIAEIIEQETGVYLELGRNHWKMEHKYQKFRVTFQWFDYHTRQQMLCKILIEFLFWYKKPDRKIIDDHYKWLEEQN